MTGTYAQKDYWDQRFEKSTGYFDWYVGWKELKSTLNPYINYEDNILMVGCGNSKMSECMYQEGYNQIVNIDISSVIINKMIEESKSKNFDKMIYLEMDATSMKFEDESFDCAIDKGTLDALSCSNSDELSSKLIQEMFRVTKIGGHIVIITHSGPNARLPLFFSCLGVGSYELNCQKISLSMMSNLINSLRAGKKNKNTTMKEALNDKSLLINSLIEVCQSKASQENDIKKDSISKMAKYLKVMQLIQEKKKAKRGTEVIESEVEVTQPETTISSKGIVEESNSTTQTISTTTETVETDDDPQQNGGKTLRRDHCFCFVLKKVSSNKISDD